MVAKLVAAFIFINVAAWMGLTLGYGWNLSGALAVLSAILFLFLIPKSVKKPETPATFRSAEQLQFDYDQAKAKRKLDEENLFQVVIQEHIDTLGRQYAQKIRKDRYGVIDRVEWEKEVIYFVEKVLGLKAGQSNPDSIFIAKRMVDEAALEKATSFAATQIADDMSPLEFEAWCSRVLEKAGWSVTTTKASGDQGADVVAHRDGYRVILQCKLYSSAVGNGAVQEAFSAQRHYGARASAVVTNAGFTRAAQELAGTTGVLLLHHSQLADMDDLLVEKGFPARRVATGLSPTPITALPPTVPRAGLDDLAARIEAAKARTTRTL